MSEKLEATVYVVALCGIGGDEGTCGGRGRIRASMMLGCTVKRYKL